MEKEILVRLLSIIIATIIEYHIMKKAIGDYIEENKLYNAIINNYEKGDNKDDK